jgi:putative hydrolase
MVIGSSSGADADEHVLSRDTDTVVNQRIAERLREAADMLGQQGANPFRVSAYRKAAETVAGLDEPIDQVFKRDGAEGLERLAYIGRGIASAIAELLRTGRWSQLERLRGALDPVTLFQTVPGIGPRLAERIHDELHIDTLEALETAAFDGRLEGVPGIGGRRAMAIRATLETLLGRVRSLRRPPPPDGPPVAAILAVDEEYRAKGAAGTLPTIAPKRFNPSGEAWLPVLHTERDDWHFSALYSNTARAHELGRTRDWVVIYFYDDHHREGQHTVVTEHRGPLMGRRVVRGREAECRDYYGQRASG